MPTSLSEHMMLTTSISRAISIGELGFLHANETAEVCLLRLVPQPMLVSGILFHTLYAAVLPTFMHDVLSDKDPLVSMNCPYARV